MASRNPCRSWLALLLPAMLCCAGCGERQLPGDGWRAHALLGTPTAIWSGAGEVVVALWRDDLSATFQRYVDGTWRPLGDKAWSGPVMSMAGERLDDLFALGGIATLRCDGSTWVVATLLEGQASYPETAALRVIGVTDDVVDQLRLGLSLTAWPTMKREKSSSITRSSSLSSPTRSSVKSACQRAFRRGASKRVGSSSPWGRLLR